MMCMMKKKGVLLSVLCYKICTYHIYDPLCEIALLIYSHSHYTISTPSHKQTQKSHFSFILKKCSKTRF
ncbi:hypothetical protein Hanom_Chr01g00067741 [Helianthus anomalus]